MITVVFPRSLNWFYETQAAAIAADLNQEGVPARAVASTHLSPPETGTARTALVVSFAECLAAVERAGAERGFFEALARFDRRILVNFDSIQSPWFAKHFVEGDGFFSAILDVGLYRQTDKPVLRSLPYLFAPEAFARADLDSIRPWSEGRPIPWAMLGHATRERAALVEAALRCLPKNGLVYSPPLRPFTRFSGLDRASIDRLLGKCDLYIWGSHHAFPYHETQRALHAVAAGAVPVKIDPLHAARIDLPWVYPSLDHMLETRARIGLGAMYRQARHYLDQQGTLGRNIKAALDHRGAPANRSGQAA